MKAYVYILKDNDNKFYIGSTVDPNLRMKQHLLGHTQTTRNMNCPRIVLTQKVDSLLTARKIEYRLKKMKRRDFIEKIIADGYIKLEK